MNCMEYVLSKLGETDQNEIVNRLMNHDYVAKKEQLQEGFTIVFTHGLHIGFARVVGCYEIVTDECSNDEIFNRRLSLFDDALKVILVNPTIIKPVEGEVETTAEPEKKARKKASEKSNGNNQGDI